ncbi:hypothetical protein WICPIJ_003289 [Wickerhamomyces pijperi]|uniref:Uncharacterized protein n=1 Tax=Wickerhamomyces pijperi TaxID=599730 RepID=A0A9P8Q9V5_WICPI|nr:hypothetical protein WICPIJ_003289 [Wickerhamomyces pijperi]
MVCTLTTLSMISKTNNPSLDRLVLMTSMIPLTILMNFNKTIGSKILKNRELITLRSSVLNKSSSSAYSLAMNPINASA